MPACGGRAGVNGDWKHVHWAQDVLRAGALFLAFETPALNVLLFLLLLEIVLKEAARVHVWLDFSHTAALLLVE